MKLLEILQKELKEFPEGMLYAVQDGDGEVKFGKHSQPEIGGYSVWQRYKEGNYPTIIGLELSEDWDSAIVTKDMWEKQRVKQISVNVSGLSIEEKQRVNEALAKITGANKMSAFNSEATRFFAPSSSGAMRVTWSPSSLPEKPTHTPQQVLEMAGMAGMTTNRKVRADFDKRKEYSVDVSNCTEDQKKEVQQAFFDAGIMWANHGKEYRHLDAVQYTNAIGGGRITKFCMYRSATEDCNMNPDEFLELVYEPEQQGHVHADLMAMYAEDAKTTDEPWELWQLKDANGKWRDLTCNPSFETDLEYRRKPKTHIVNGVEVPDLRFVPMEGAEYYLPYPIAANLYLNGTYMNHKLCQHRASNNLCYELTEEGKQAAILHAKAWLGIA